MPPVGAELDQRSAMRARDTRSIVILGGDETGLAVLRNAAALGLRPTVVARPGDISTRSRLARAVILDGPEAGDALTVLCGLTVTGARPPLVATNDRWLRFIVAHRAALDERFTLLHPGNDTLDICLNKRRFAEWAFAHGLPTPALACACDATPMAAVSSLPFPLLLRPEWSNHGPRVRLPKASPVATDEEFLAAVRVFEAAGVPWVATRSLLAEARVHHSVAVAVRDHRWLSFVARKLRPLPDQCAVGSCVALRPHPAAESLARVTLRAMGFEFGVAEVEIIETVTGQLFVIEVNPRPWTQFALAYRSGHDILAFLLDRAAAPSPAPRTAGLAWIDVPNDLFACFSRSTGVVRHGRLRLTDYLRSLAGARVFSAFAVGDPVPGLGELLRVAGSALRSTRLSPWAGRRRPDR